MLTPQIPGIVVKIYAEDTTLVEEGQVLIELDPTDQKLIFEKSVNALAQTVRDVSQMFASVYQLAADLDAAKAEAVKAEIYFTDRDALKATGAISVEDYITAELNFFAAKANMASLEFALMKAITAVQGTTVSTHPLVKGAADEVKTQWVALERCKIRAPQTGIIAERMVQVGESVAPDTPLLAVVPLEQMWVEANYKEVQLEGVRLGQPVVMRSDLYGGDCLYRGEVVGIAAGTGAAFSLLPPQNATGNWIKIVQRVPVRVKLNPEQLKAYPLRIGLSMEAKVDIHNQQASRVPLVPCQGPLYETRVFQSQEKGAEALVAQIIEENMFYEE
jgi:membrane fusion protein (multidrug efflux system)